MRLARGGSRLLWVFVVALAIASFAVAQDDTTARVAAIKEWLGQSKAQLKQYQWLETTTVSHKGEVKSTSEKNCYYDVNGELQKVATGAQQEDKKKFGIRGAIQKNAKEEMQDYMQDAVELVRSYIPPNPELIQRSKDAGKMSIDVLSATNVRLNFADYKKNGDKLSITVDKATNKLLGIGVNSYLDTTKDAVTLAVPLGSLPDGTGYASKTVLNAAAKDLEVDVVNTGYRKGGN